MPELLGCIHGMSAGRSAWGLLTQRVNASLNQRLIRPHAAAQNCKHSTGHSGSYGLRAQAHRRMSCSVGVACLEGTVCTGFLGRLELGEPVPSSLQPAAVGPQNEPYSRARSAQTCSV